MSNDNTHAVHEVIRVYSEVRKHEKDGKVHGFQTCGIVKGEGRIEEFEQYFDASKSPQWLAPGDYRVVAAGLYLDRSGRLQLGREFIAVKSATKAA